MSPDDRERLLRRLNALESESASFQRQIDELRRELARLKDYEVETHEPAHPSPPPPGPTDPTIPEVAERAGSDKYSIERARKTVDLEFWLGGRGLLLVGVTALVFAVAFFVKEAIDRGWVGPTIRVLAGAGVGIAVAIAGERIRAMGYRTYGLWLAAGGFSAIYVSIWSAVVLYSLIPTSVGFILMLVVVVASAALGVLRDSESFVVLAAFGGYLVPVLLQVETTSAVFGLGYLAMITGAGLVLADREGWAYVAAVSVFGGALLPLLSEGQPHLHGVYLVFVIVSALIVARRCAWPTVSLLAVMFGWIALWVGADGWGISELVFSGYAFAIWLANLVASVGVTDWVGADSGDAPPQPSEDALAFRQETMPLVNELSGLAVTVLPPWFFLLSATAGFEDSIYSNRTGEFGLVLAVVLGAVYLAQAVAGPAGRGAGNRLWRAGLGFAFWLAAPRVLWDNAAVTRAWLVEGVAFTVAGVVLKRLEARTAGLAAFALAVFTYWGALSLRPVSDVAFVGVWALTGLVACIGLAAWAMTLERVDEPASWETAIRPIAFLAAAVFFLGWGTGELLRFFEMKSDPERWELARDLSISAFWLIYATALLAFGFWRNQAAIRWAGLGMVLIAAAKVFIYDLSNLARLYRIGSFVLLAIVLLALSFWYQKIRGSEEESPS